MGFIYFFSIFAIFCTVCSVVIDADSDTFFEIPRNKEVTAKISSRPSAGLIWAMIAEDSSRIQVVNHYGEFSLGQENRKQGFQKFNFTCKDCEWNQDYVAYFVLKRPWKENYSEIRKVYFTIS